MGTTKIHRTGGVSTSAMAQVAAVAMSAGSRAAFSACGVNALTGTLGLNRREARRRGGQKQSPWYRAFERKTFR